METFDNTFNNYDASSIELLKGLEPVRKNPSMYIGNTDVEGLHHLVYELIDNSADEFLAGYCSQILVAINKDGTVSVEDNGRGIPVDLHKKEKISALELVMTRLHAGGKFNRETYKVSGGLHGIGASIITALAEWSYVEVRRNKQIHRQDYSRGKKTSNVKVVGKTKHTGTKTVFLPDKKIFNVLKFDFDTIATRIKERAYLNSNLKLNLHDERSDKSVEYRFDGGIQQFVNDLNEGREIIHDDVIYIHKDLATFDLEVAFQYRRSSQDNLLSFANNINTVNGGVHLNAFKNALLKVVDEHIEKSKLLKGLSLRVLPRDVTDGLTAVINIKLPDPQFEGQTKTKLNNYQIRVDAEELCKKEITEYFKNNSETRERIIGKIAEAIRIRDAANKAKKLVKRKSGFDALNLPVKLTDCVSKDPEECELVICEGESAGCFEADTQIMIKSGLKAINKIEKGDFALTHKNRFRKVYDTSTTRKRNRAVVTVDGHQYICSDDHPYLVNRNGSLKWVKIRDLRKTDYLVFLNHYKFVKPDDIQFFEDDSTDLYDISVEDDESFVLENGLVVHNSGLRKTRNKNTQAVLCLKGKILNVEGIAINKILESDEIKNIVSALGVNIKNANQEKNGLRYNRIIILTDADVDGQHITALLLTLFYRYMKKVIEEGHLYIAKPPLYRIIYGNKAQYVESEEELDLQKKNHKNLTVQRFKGLGEMNPDQLFETTLNLEKRKIDKVVIEDSTKAEELLVTLMGNDASLRRQFIIDNAKTIEVLI